MSQPLLEATNISHSFDYPLFKQIDFTIEPTQSAAIVGRSGSGKSTLLHIFSTFMKPNEGKIILLGNDLYNLSDEEIESLRRYDIGIIFQFHYHCSTTIVYLRLQESIPRINTGISMSETPRFSRSQTNCSKYDTPVDISLAKDLTGTISIPASIKSIL